MASKLHPKNSASREDVTNFPNTEAIVPVNFRIDCIVGRYPTDSLAVDFPFKFRSPTASTGPVGATWRRF